LLTNGKLRCDMKKECEATVSHIDNKGFVYCEGHGIQRRYFVPCRKPRPAEVKKLEGGVPLKEY
jgi:hypothetical protein